MNGRGKTDGQTDHSMIILLASSSENRISTFPHSSWMDG